MVKQFAVVIVSLGAAVALGPVGCAAKIGKEQATQIDSNFAFVVKKHDQLAERVKKLEDALEPKKKAN